MVDPAILRSNLYRLAHVLHWGRHGNVHPHKLHRHVLEEGKYEIQNISSLLFAS